MPQHLIIDTDPGVDDAMALILALRSPEVQVEAVTTVGGNVALAQTTRNALRVLELVNPRPRPVLAVGGAPPARRGAVRAKSVHGKDGLGELDRFLRQDGSPMYPQVPIPPGLPSAKEVTLELLERYPEELLMVCLGPLTNLAGLIRTAPEKLRRLGGVIAMGGAIQTGGNVTPAAEFNIYADPQAARIVFASGLPLTLVPLDVTRQVRLHREDLEGLPQDGSDPVASFLRNSTAKALAFMEEREGTPSMALHDPLAVGVAVQPSLVSTFPLHVEVETRGRLTCGMTVADRRPIRAEFKEPPNVQVALEVDSQRFLSFFKERICPRWWS
jgi:inosine-uridine nucleoside N-ribohydrolase